MKTRTDVIIQAADECMKELYSLAQPKVTWDEFIKENEEYSKKYKLWEYYRSAEQNKDKNPKEWEEIKNKFPESWENASIVECIGPRPFEFYYLDKEILKEIADSYVYAYQIDVHKHLLDTISLLKSYCKETIVSKWIEDKNGGPGHKGYDHPDNLEKQLRIILEQVDPSFVEIAGELQNKFFEFLDMAGKFYNSNYYLNSFNMNVYLGASPSSNKEAVIENWKKFRNKDITIKNINLYDDEDGE